MFFLDLFNFRMIGRIIESRLKQANVLAREAVNTPMYWVVLLLMICIENCSLY